jgi:hypothetical protein
MRKGLKLSACFLAAAVAVPALTHADPYAGTSLGKATCAEYNQLNANAQMAMGMWLEGYIAGAVRIGKQAKLARYDQLDQLNIKMIWVIADGACKAAPNLVFETLAGNILGRILDEPAKYK